MILLLFPFVQANGDANEDGLVNMADIHFVLQHYHSSDAQADRDADGDVDLFDLVLVARQWGMNVTTPVPDPTHPNEPAGMTLVAAMNGTIAEAGGRALGLPNATPWNPDSGNVAVVDDPSNPTGSGKAVRLHWDPATAGVGTFSLDIGRAQEVYVALRMVQESPWTQAHKFFYLRPVGSSLPGPITTIEPSWSWRVVANGVELIATAIGLLDIQDQPMLLEWHWVAPSTTTNADGTTTIGGTNDGRVDLWLDGVHVGSTDQLSFGIYEPTEPRFGSFEFYGTANVVSDHNYMRIHELYVSTKE